jgi:hypothetical protein
MADLIHEIEAFCEAQDMSPWQFGVLALNDKPFVKQVRDGRRVWPETEAKVRSFMASYSPTRQQGAAAA